MTEVYAVTPRANGGGMVLHLYVPGYRPGVKKRSPTESAMCNAPIWQTLSYGPGRGTIVRHHVPLAQALEWTATPPTDPFDPRPAWRWCPACAGRFIEAYGDLTAALRAIDLPPAPQEGS